MIVWHSIILQYRMVYLEAPTCSSFLDSILESLTGKEVIAEKELRRGLQVLRMLLKTAG